MNKDIKLALVLSSIFLFLAVAFGAFGAHGLEGKISPRALNTWGVGVTYQFYHGFALLALASLHARLVTLKPKWPYRFFVIGIFLFSFNCYLYALTGFKLFALIIPVGGVSFLLGWLFTAKTFIKDI